MRILQINNNLKGGGAEVEVANISRFLDTRSVPNAVAAYQGPSREDGRFFRIYCPPNMLESLVEQLDTLRWGENTSNQLFEDPNKSVVKRASINLRRLIPLNDPVTRFSVRKVLGSFQPDLVHVHKIMPSLAPLNVAYEEGMKIVVTAHGYWPICPLGNLVRGDGSLCDSRDWRDCRRHCSWPYVRVGSYMKRLRETLIEKVDVIITISRFMKHRMIEFGYPPAMMEVIYNGIEDLPRIDSASPVTPYALFSGRLTTHKGPDVFIEAAHVAKKRGLELDFILVGAKQDVDLTQKIVGDFVKILPWMPREEIAAMMKGAICTVVPSIWHEPFGLVAIESHSQGTPVIATRAGGLPEIVEDGSNGYLIDVGDRHLMAQAIVDRLEQMIDEPSLHRDLSQKSLDTYKERFTDTIMGRNYLHTYRQLVGE